MEREKTIHVLNGMEMERYFRETGFLKDEVTAPFNEAMCYGETCEILFSQAFIETRAKVHQVTEAAYREITLKPLEKLLHQDFSRVVLWFDADMFCQINLLSILAWLEQLNYKGAIELQLVDMHFKPIEQFALQLEGYEKLYKQVLIEKKSPDYIALAPLKKGIALYEQYVGEDNELVEFIKQHLGDSDQELVLKLLQQFPAYGLGDTQYIEMIQAQRRTLRK